METKNYMKSQFKIYKDMSRWEIKRWEEIPANGNFTIEFNSAKEMTSFINSKRNIIPWNTKLLKILKVNKIRQSKMHVNIIQVTIRENNLNILLNGN